jgi:hypothetical protein
MCRHCNQRSWGRNGYGLNLHELNAYYREAFERDLEKVIGSHVPRYFGVNWRLGGCTELSQVAEPLRPYFVACLYYSVVIDQGICHHLHDTYSRSKLFSGYPKYCNGPSSGHKNPREILRYSCVHGMVDHDCLMILAEPAAQLFVPEIAETLQRYLPKANVGEFFYLWTGFPEMNCWSTRVARRFPREVLVEKSFFLHLRKAASEWVPA